ncbi:hypothetical protein ADUPG1_006019 [Aduncisulcus paluster]|uniref:Uncharacterized protein n=1 Tax=Aduncisulcus paluster TaxID=2918883 RepID=A0ABQ5KGI0_9EUKA|nr:hypothetical protein ADUPG1_006019 [Aduncisulcus paluster]
MDTSDQYTVYTVNITNLRLLCGNYRQYHRENPDAPFKDDPAITMDKMIEIAHLRRKYHDSSTSTEFYDDLKRILGDSSKSLKFIKNPTKISPSVIKESELGVILPSSPKISPQYPILHKTPLHSQEIHHSIVESKKAESIYLVTPKTMSTTCGFSSPIFTPIQIIQNSSPIPHSSPVVKKSFETPKMQTFEKPDTTCDVEIFRESGFILEGTPTSNPVRGKEFDSDSFLQLAAVDDAILGDEFSNYPQDHPFSPARKVIGRHENFSNPAFSQSQSDFISGDHSSFALSSRSRKSGICDVTKASIVQHTLRMRAARGLSSPYKLASEAISGQSAARKSKQVFRGKIDEKRRSDIFERLSQDERKELESIIRDRVSKSREISHSEQPFSSPTPSKPSTIVGASHTSASVASLYSSPVMKEAFVSREGCGRGYGRQPGMVPVPGSSSSSSSGFVSTIIRRPDIFGIMARSPARERAAHNTDNPVKTSFGQNYMCGMVGGISDRIDKDMHKK